MKNIRRNYFVLVPVGIALLSFLAGGAVNVHLLSREYDSDTTTIIYFSFVALILSAFLFGIFWVILGRVRSSIEDSAAEREATEKELIQTELWYRSVFDGVNDAVLVETVKGEVLDVNARACEMFGWTRLEFLTKTIRDMVPPEYQALLPEEQDETTLSEEPFETVNMRANGEIFPVSVSGRLQIIGEEKRLLIVLRDITEQKRIEEELKKQHQFLSHVIESLSQPFYVINVDDYSIEISNSAARGGKALPAGTTCYALTHHRDTPCSGEDHPCPLKDVVKSKGVVQYEHIHYDHDGNPRNFEVHGYPIFNAQGEIKQMIEYSLDITERKKAEEELHKLSRAVTHSPSSVVITDANARISYVNPAYLEGTGYTEDEVLGKFATFLYSDLHSKEFYKDIWNKVSAGDMWRGEIGSRTSQGEIMWDAVSIAPIVDEKGNITNFVGVMEDITANKELLKETEKAKEAAEAAAQAKADFLANMSHEIRTPLNAIYGMTSLMLDTPLNAEQQDFIETIRGGSDTLLKVINDILDFSKIEAGKMELETQPFYVRNCVEDALDLLAEKAASKMLDLAYFVEDDTPPVVIGDITRVRQILVNLLNNAIKFTDKGEVVVNVKSMLVENDQHELTFSVRDTGIGIPADKIEKLFKSFSQVDTSTTRKYGGTGLGLAISNQLAQNMGGRMWVKSEEGEGSTFYFTILVKAQQNAKPLYAKDEVPQLAGKRILIVDDNETNRLILIKQAESWGMKPRALSSGPEALTLLAEGEEFDIAILDMQMPEMDGFTLATKISEKKKNALPLIILTSIKREKTRSSDAKITAFLNKPIKTSNLFNVLMGIIDTAPAPQVKEKKPAKIDGNMAVQHPLRLLLAEDNVINQKVALKLLSKLGYQADLAGNGLEAIAALERQTYDVILMDIQMPEMDGDEATRQIRAKWSQDRQPHIVAMTAHALEGDREKYIDRGMDDYVSKPIKVDSLVAALKKAPRVD
ncbi:MAG: PAS domain S-box protein [Anaerolineae bacterium]|jgi:PAS domain S-box-containing protein|nr:PAS domain S-box protein [Anaerolineae bacterium]MBT7189961.1 PAS domain S-box protein [Anaerolineae bacterium]MBT7990763.1 PAS domain S-box protein [Anaerolineae bacterium]